MPLGSVMNVAIGATAEGQNSTNNNDIGVDVDEDLIPVPSSLRALDDSLRCGICQELMKAAVTISKRECGHSFCSECIRRTFRAGLISMKRKACCPVCRYHVTDHESSLVPNRTLQETIIQYTKIRGTLRAVLGGNGGSEMAESLGKGDNDTKSTTITQETKPKAKIAQRPSPKNARARDGVNCNEDNSDGDDDNDDDGNINDLIEVVSHKNSTEASSVAVVTSMKKRPTLRYSSMKRKRLQELCTKDGLPTHGTDDELKARLQTFVTLWNAETDSINPKSQEQLVQEIKRREMAARKEKYNDLAAGAGAHVRLMKNVKDSRKQLGESYDKSGVASKVSSGNLAFDKKMDEGFKRLIDNLKKRKRESQQGDNTNESKNDTEKDIKDTKTQASCKETESTTAFNLLAKGDGNKTVGADQPESSPPQTSSNNPNQTMQKKHRIEVDAEGVGETSQCPIIISPTGSTDTSQMQKNAEPQNKRAKLAPSAKTSTKTSSLGGTISGPWNCHVCTYFNSTRTWTTAKCEMCNSRRLSSAKVSHGVHRYVANDI